jgi:hypothetical protein
MANRDIIVIGGSAGAAAPLKEILSGFPPFIVLHTPARGIGLLAAMRNRPASYRWFRRKSCRLKTGISISPHRTTIS